MRVLWSKVRRYADLAFYLCALALTLLLVKRRLLPGASPFFPIFLFSYQEFLNWLWSVWTRVMDFFRIVPTWGDDLYNNACRILRDWWGRVGMVLDSWWGQITHLNYILYANLQRLTEGIWDRVSNFFDSLYDRVAALLEMSWSKVFDVCTNWYDRIRCAIYDYWDKLYSLFHDLYDKLKELTVTLWAQVVFTFYTMYYAIYDTCYYYYGRLKAFLTGWWERARDFFDNLYVRAEILFRQKWDWLMGLVVGAVQDVLGIVTAKWPILAWWFTEGWDFWGSILVEPKNLPYIVFELLRVFRDTYRAYLYQFAEHCLRYLWEGVW